MEEITDIAISQGILQVMDILEKPDTEEVEGADGTAHFIVNKPETKIRALLALTSAGKYISDRRAAENENKGMEIPHELLITTSRPEVNDA